LMSYSDVSISRDNAHDDVPVLAVTVEGVAYVGLLIFIALSYLLRLGDVPLTVDEVPRALAAWASVYGEPSRAVLPADSALLQLLHMSALSAFGISEAVVRVPTALAGIALTFSPLLFRDLLGRGRTFVMTALLASSAVMLAASRLDSPAVWEVGLAVVGLWAAVRYTRTEAPAWAIGAAVAWLSAALLAGTGGVAIVVTLAGAVTLTGRFLPPEDDFNVVTLLAAWPWRQVLAVAAPVVLVIATAFMTYPAGLDAVAVALAGGLTGWLDGRFAFALLNSLTYEPILWIFGVAGLVSVTRQDVPRPLDVFFAAWGGVATLAATVYGGAAAAHALWLTLPLAGLASGVVVNLLRDDDGVLWADEGDRRVSVMGFSVPAWGVWLVTAISAALFSLILMHLGGFGRALLTANFAAGSGWSAIAPSGLILLVLVLLTVFVGFTVASVWGGGVTLRGGAFGLLFVGVVAMSGSGWQLAYSRADSPLELWHTTAYGADVFVLRDTLLDLADRETGGFPELAVTLVVPPEYDDNQAAMLGWILRDFDAVTVVPTVSAARAQAVVIAPYASEPPNLGGNYLGQSFTLRRAWSPSTLTVQAFPAWWFQRRTRVPAEVETTVVLWLREDIYAGVDLPALP
jgi:hypothetical protein